MGRFDLNSAADFAKLTLSDASSILQDFTGNSAKDWDILEGSFNGVLFHVFKSKEVYDGALGSISDMGGRRKVKYRFPYRDGQTTDDLGRKPESFDLDILIFGPKYMTGLTNLMRELNKPTPGELIHPIRGKIKCVPEDYHLLHTSEKRQAVTIRLTFIEHSFTIGEFKSSDDSTVKGALARAIEAFASIEAAITNVTGAVIFVNNVKNKVAALLSDYKTGYAQLLASINQAFNGSGSVDIPTLLPVNNGGLQNPDGTTSSGSFPTVTTPSDPFQSVPISSVSSQTATAIATVQITKNANTLRDNLAVIIQQMSQGAGALEFYDEILALKKSAILLQDALEKGIASSKSRIVSFTTPRVMSIREVAFATGLPIDRVYDLEVLNPSLLSLNYIDVGTVLKVPVS